MHFLKWKLSLGSCVSVSEGSKASSTPHLVVGRRLHQTSLQAFHLFCKGCCLPLHAVAVMLAGVQHLALESNTQRGNNLFPCTGFKSRN